MRNCCSCSLKFNLESADRDIVFVSIISSLCKGTGQTWLRLWKPRLNHRPLAFRKDYQVRDKAETIYVMQSMTKLINIVVSVACAALLCFTLAKSANAKDALATAARISGDAQQTQFEVDLSKAVGFTVDVLPDPYRVVIDIAGLNFDLPPGIGQKGQGLISSFRYGIVDEGKSRIVLDTTGPVLIDNSQSQPGKGKKLAHLVVNLLAASPENFSETFAKDHGTEPDLSTATILKPPVKPELAEVPVDLRKVIVIDPGHGGIDPGAISPSKTLEKDVVLKYGIALRTELEKSGRYKVVMTRSDDTFVRLEKRVEFARENKADLFIAIHADTVHGQQARGVTVYTVSDQASDAEAEALAQKENRADIIAGMDLATESKDVANILINLAQRESRNRAMAFSKKAVNELKNVSAFTGKPIRSAAFVVLKAPDVPSVLIELGYLSSKQDEALLTSAGWHKRMAAGMAKAIDSYFAPALTTAQK